jgi:hypothetical protein
MFLLVLFFCQSPCYSNEYNCDKNKKNEFSLCIINEFPIGSSYLDLYNYLTIIGFKKSINNRRGEFYFFWWKNDFGNYKVAVFGKYDDKLNITEVIVR